MRAPLVPAALAFALSVFGGCGEKEEPVVSGDTAVTDERLAKRLSGTIRVDGPRVLHPLTSRAASNFETETPVEVEVGRSGTEVALDKLCSGRIAVAGARRPMTAAERGACRQRGIEVERLKIANHAVAVVTSPELEIRCVTMRQLRELWKPGSSVTRYEQLGPAFPSGEVELYGPKITRDSFALFTRRVNGDVGAIRSRWEAAVNRSALTARLERSSHALAFYNFAELTPVIDVRLVAVDAGDGCVKPTKRNVQSGSYPLREDLYLYVSKPQLAHLRVRSFMQYFVEDYDQLALVAPPTMPASAREIAEAERRLPEAEIPSG